MTGRQGIFLAIMAGGIFLLRALPMLLFGRSGKVPGRLVYLGQALTAAAIAMLVVYSAFGATDHAACGYDRLPAALACLALTALLQAAVRNPLLSILAGTIAYMAWIQALP